MHDSSDHLPPTAKEIGYFRVTNRSFEDVDRVLSLTDAVNKLKPNSKVLDIGSGLFQHTASGIRKLRSDIFVVSSDATLGLESDHFWIMDSDEDGKGRQTTYSSKANYISDPQKLMSESYQQDRRNEAVNSIASLQPSLPFAADSFDLIIDSWGPGMYLDRTSSDPTRNSHMSVYLDNICRILKHQGEFRMYPIDAFTDTLLSDEDRNQNALRFFRNYFQDKKDDFVIKIFKHPDHDHLRHGLILQKI